MPTTGRPTGDDRDHDFRHEADEPLHLEDVEAARAGRPIGILVAVSTADALVATRAERPAAILRARSVAGEQHDPNSGVLSRVIEHPIEFVDRLRTKGVAHLRPVEGDARHSSRIVVMVGDVGECGEAGDGFPGARLEELGNIGHCFSLGSPRSAAGGPDSFMHSHP